MSSFPFSPIDDPAEALASSGARFNRALLTCREVLLRAWKDPVLGPRYRRIVKLQAVGVLALAAGLLAMGIGIHEVATDAPLSSRVYAVLASCWGALLGAHWGVIALSYRYHDVLTREASLLVGLPPEDPDLPPRVALDLGWIRKRIRRRIRGFMVMVPGFVAIWFFSLVTGRAISSVLSALWISYWWVVFSLAKSARAWPEPAPTAPWYLRAWDAMAGAVPILETGPFRWWRNYLASSSSSVWSPISWSERLPAQGAALALMRLGANVPGLGMAVRPLVPLCAGLVIEHGDGALDFLRRAPPPHVPGMASGLESGVPARLPPEPPLEL